MRAVSDPKPGSITPLLFARPLGDRSLYLLFRPMPCPVEWTGVYRPVIVPAVYGRARHRNDIVAAPRPDLPCLSCFLKSQLRVCTASLDTEQEHCW